MVHIFPPRFAQLKQDIAASVPNFQARVTESWVQVIEALGDLEKEISKNGSAYIPQVNYSEIDNLSQDQIDIIKRRGTVVIKDVVPDEDALKWKATLDKLIDAHHDELPGFPEDKKQFIHAYWTQPQVQARSHPNMLKVQAWLNNLYHARSNAVDGLDQANFATPLTYADRFRIRHPGGMWNNHPPHIDGGSIERWEEPNFRACFMDILGGDWHAHDPYDLGYRVKAKTSLYGRPNQSTVFRTFQGWIALEEIHPGQGTLRVFPDILLSNAYIILRPFFKPKVPIDSEGIYDPKNWEFDTSFSDFPGLLPGEKGYNSAQPTQETHPHLRLAKTMTSIPPVKPGDNVFWHCDGIHSVEPEHTGDKDSAVMYIPAVPSTPQNLEYIQKQKQSFLEGGTPPDYPQVPSSDGKAKHEDKYLGAGTVQDILSEDGKRAMGF